MIGELSIGGVFIPSLVFLGMVTLLAFGFLSALMSIVGAYRLFAHRPLVDIALLVVLMGVAVAISSRLQALNS